MSFNEPLGLLILGFIPLFIIILNRALRRRRIKVSSFHLLKEVIDALPILPRSFLLLKKIQMLLLLSAIVLLALSAGGLVLGSPSASPVTAIVLLDHLSNWKDPVNRTSGWRGVIDTAKDLIGSFRGDDRLLVVRSDTGTVPVGLLSPGRAASMVGGMSPSELPLNPEKVLDELRLMARTYTPEVVFVITPFPSRWQDLQSEEMASIKIVRSPPPPATPNYGILDVEIRPDLLRPQEVSLFCRIGAFASFKEKGPFEATLLVSNNDELVIRKSVLVSPGESRGIVLPHLTLEPGLLALRLAPSDHFPDDNFFLAPIRSRPFLTAILVSHGNHALEAALRSLPGLSLTVFKPGESPPEAAPEVIVYDNLSPETWSDNLLVIRPPRSIPGLTIRGEVSRPRIIEVDNTHPVLEEVSFDALKIGNLPVLLPSPSMRVIAKANGYPFLMVGKSPAGGRVTVLGFDPVDSGWIYDSSFPILIANLMAWLGEEPLGIRSSFLVGEPPPGKILQGAIKIIDPNGDIHSSHRSGWEPSPFALAGRYNIIGRSASVSGEIFVNLLQEEVSRSMVSERADQGGPIYPSFFPRPFRFEMSKALLLGGVVLLLLEILIAPRARVGRLPE